MIVARVGSPLVIGLGEGENFIASDATPLAGHTDKVVYLSDHELAYLTPEGIEIQSFRFVSVRPRCVAALFNLRACGEEQRFVASTSAARNARSETLERFLDTFPKNLTQIDDL